jgi:hypothetical protein
VAGAPGPAAGGGGRAVPAGSAPQPVESEPFGDAGAPAGAGPRAGGVFRAARHRPPPHIASGGGQPLAKELLERPAVVGRGGGIYRHRFAVPEAGEAILNMRIAAAGTHWGKDGFEAGTLRIEFEGSYSQHLVVFGGAEETLYQRFVGDIGIGAHEVMWTFSPEGSAQGAQWIRTISMAVDVITRDDPRYIPASNCPLLYGRAERDSYEMRRSDTPMYAFYRYPQGGPTGREIEFFYMYSHLNQGQDPAQRLAQTGQLAPIEWSFRGSLDSAGHVAKNLAFQGRNHAPHGFAGTFDMRGHPVLQAVGNEGMFHDKQVTPYRLALPALEAVPDDRPLAWMQNVYPVSYRIAAYELSREAKIEKPGNPASKALADPHDYLFLHLGRRVLQGDARNAPPVEVLVTLRGASRPLSSSFGDARWLRPGAEPLATAVKCPPGTAIQALSEVRVRAVPQRRDPFQIELSGPQAAFFLTGANYEVGPMAAGVPAERKVVLTREDPEAVLYRAGD